MNYLLRITLKLDDSALRKVCLSFGKIKNLKALAQLVESGGLDFSMLEIADDESAIQMLVQVRGVGKWTAEMYLMFCMNRPDILPLEDAAIEAAMKRL